MNPAPQAASIDAQRHQRASTLALLNRLRLHRVPLTVQINNALRGYSTCILAVDPDPDALHLDALYPTPSVAPQPGARLRLRGRLDGGLLRFDTELGAMAINDDGPILRARIPEHIELLEQRAARRQPIGAGPDAPTLALESGSGRSIAQLLDLSILGASALAPIEATAPIGSQLRCHFDGPGALPFTAEVRSRTPRGRWQRLGLRFARLRREEEDRLVATLLRLERRAIRRMPLHA